MMLAAATVLGLVIGAVIGGLGGGGGVLAVPALVYVLGESARDATTSSVVIVGVTAAVGALVHIRSGGVDLRTAGFGAVGIPAAYLGTLLNHRVAQPVLMLTFAVLTLAAAVALLLDSRHGAPAECGTAPIPVGPGGATTAVAARTDTEVRPVVGTLAKVVAYGVAVGFLTGLLGVGGGFLVVPALVIALRMPMTLAVGTSLTIIALNSASSLVSRLGVAHPDWRVIAPFTVAAVTGALIGKRVGDRLSAATLTTSFAVLLLLVGLAVGVQSTLALR
jgi:uncharacterized membrane protein YfcA